MPPQVPGVPRRCPAFSAPVHSSQVAVDPEEEAQEIRRVAQYNQAVLNERCKPLEIGTFGLADRIAHQLCLLKVGRKPVRQDFGSEPADVRSPWGRARSACLQVPRFCAIQVLPFCQTLIETAETLGMPRDHWLSHAPRVSAVGL